MNRLAASLPLLVLLAACGGGGGAKKSDYVSKAESICSKANDEQDKLTEPAAIGDVVPYIQQIVDIAEKATKDLVALEEPKDDKADLEKKFLDPLAKQIDEGKEFKDQVAKAVDDKDSATLQQLISDPPTQTEADLTWMKSYGFKDCVTAADTDS